MKHTPGLELHPYVTSKGGVVILNGPFPIEKARRVAALCEASPDLLAALKTMLRDDEMGEDVCQRTGFPRLSERREMAKAAIAKAEQTQEAE